MELSKYQQAIVKYFKENPTSNMLIEALAGSGKTYTLLELLKDTKTSDIYLAFNNSVAKECKEKITNTKIKVYTFHSLAYSIMNYNLSKNNFGNGIGKTRTDVKADLDNFKIYNIVDNLIQRKHGKYVNFEFKIFLRENYVQLYNLIRLTYIPFNDTAKINKIITDYNLFIDYSENGFGKPTLEEILRWVKDIYRISNMQFEESNKIDFTDMLYITHQKLLEKEWEVPYYNYYTNITVDEAQDLNNLQLSFLKFIKRKNGRYIFCGDYHQSCYAFSGANAYAWKLIPTMFAPIERFELPICYRCPVLHLQRVNKTYNIPILPREDAPLGEIKIIDKQDITDYIEAGDMVISRKNKWLGDVVSSLVTHNIPIFFEDKEMVESLKKMVNNFKVDDTNELRKRILQTINQARKNLSVLLALETENEILTTEEQQKKVEEILSMNSKVDNLKFLLKILDAYLKEKSNRPIVYFISHLNKLLNTVPNKNSVRICSIHKAKGLEAENVFVLNQALVEKNFKSSKEQNQQEENLSYIATTRAKNKLYLVKEPIHD